VVVDDGSGQSGRLYKSAGTNTTAWTLVANVDSPAGMQWNYISKVHGNLFAV
jgi:hypothetical protein